MSVFLTLDSQQLILMFNTAQEHVIALMELHVEVQVGHEVCVFAKIFRTARVRSGGGQGGENRLRVNETLHFVSSSRANTTEVRHFWRPETGHITPLLAATLAWRASKVSP